MPVNGVIFAVVDPLSELYDGPDELIVIRLIEYLDSLDERSVLLVEHFFSQTGGQFIKQCLLIHLSEELEVVVDEIGPDLDLKVIFEVCFLRELFECFEFSLFRRIQIRSEF